MAAPVNGVYAPPVITQIDERDPTGVALAGLNYANKNKNNFGFINRETIAETGWIDLNNRFFDPFINRFHQIDPITNGQEHLSLYQYGWNNPVLNTDPNGDCPSCPQGADAAKVYATGAVVNNKDGSWTWTGSEWKDNPTVSAVEPSMADRWSEGSFGQRVVYGFADGIYSMFGGRHLNGNTFDSYDDKIKTKLGGLMTLGGPLLSGESAAANVVDEGIAELASLNPTQYITKSESVMKDFVRTIKSDGIINESISFVEHNGSKFIVDGHHRFFAAQKLGIQNVPVQRVQLPFKGYQTTSDLILSGKQPGWWKFYKP